MKKFAAIFAAVLITVSVFMVSASAKLLSDSTVYFYDDVSFSSIPFYSSGSDSTVTCYSFYVYDPSGNLVTSGGAESDFPLSRNSASASDYPPFTLYFNGESYPLIPGVSGYTIDLYSTSSSLTFLSIGSVSGSAVSNPSMVSQIPGSIFDVGSSLLSFVTANWLTLLSITAFVVVLCFGAIRRLIKGV